MPKWAAQPALPGGNWRLLSLVGENSATDKFHPDLRIRAGAIVPLGYELQMGDRIEILTNKNSKPSRDWLNIVKTSSAKSKIRNFFSKVTREDDLIRGRDELAKVMRKHGLGIGSKSAEKAIAIGYAFRFPDVEPALTNLAHMRDVGA